MYDLSDVKHSQFNSHENYLDTKHIIQHNACTVFLTLNTIATTIAITLLKVMSSL